MSLESSVCLSLEPSPDLHWLEELIKRGWDALSLFFKTDVLPGKMGKKKKVQMKITQIYPHSEDLSDIWHSLLKWHERFLYIGFHPAMRIITKGGYPQFCADKCRLQCQMCAVQRLGTPEVGRLFLIQYAGDDFNALRCLLRKITCHL